jgi:DNA adenine methylase
MRTSARTIARRGIAAPRVAALPALAPTPATPILKWAGGKSKLLGELTARAPGAFRRYFEPFLGGGAMFFHLAPSASVLTDRNTDLINVYRCVAWNVEAVIQRLRNHRQRHGEAYYYEMRERWNEGTHALGDVDRAAAFIYLNKTCYNGLWRVNSRGQFNVPAGRYDAPQIYDDASIRAASRLLQRAELRAGHFAHGVESADAGDFVYFDPPYHPLNDTAKFTSYTADSFDADDQRELAAVARALACRGCHVMISNSDTPFVRELYSGFRVERVQCPRAINSNSARRGLISEVIITSDE